jgi:hypothetical protein
MKKRKFAEGGETAEEKLGKYIRVPSEAVGGRFPAVKSKLPAASRAARLAEGKEPMENTMRDYAEAEVLEGDNLRKTAKQNIADERQKISELADQYKRETRGKKAGGTVRSASSRADGIASKGKTRGKIC